MLERRYRPGVSVLNNKIYVMGGEEGWDRYHDTIECYDPDKDAWELVGDMPTSRSWLSCVSITMGKKLPKPKDTARNSLRSTSQLHSQSDLYSYTLSGV